jgi:hypothetical protein
MGQDKWHKLDGDVAHMLNYISHGRLKSLICSNTELLAEN